MSKQIDVYFVRQTPSEKHFCVLIPTKFGNVTNKIISIENVTL